MAASKGQNRRPREARERLATPTTRRGRGPACQNAGQRAWPACVRGSREWHRAPGTNQQRPLAEHPAMDRARKARPGKEMHASMLRTPAFAHSGKPPGIVAGRNPAGKHLEIIMAGAGMPMRQTRHTGRSTTKTPRGDGTVSGNALRPWRPPLPFGNGGGTGWQESTEKRAILVTANPAAGQGRAAPRFGRAVGGLLPSKQAGKQAGLRGKKAKGGITCAQRPPETCPSRQGR